MSRITSSSYPVTTISQDGDLFVIVRNGQVYKVTRAALQAFIESITPQNTQELSGMPGTLVGQGGKVLTVKVAEDGYELVSGAANSYVGLPDGPGSFSGEALKVPRVNAGETAMEYFTQALLLLSDTPSTFAGTSLYLVRVNAGANAIEFVPTGTAIPDNLTGGWFDYNHGGGTQAYTGGSGYVKLLNDATGPRTTSTYSPVGVSSVWNTGTNQLDLSQLSLGDVVVLRVDVIVTTTAANQVVQGQAQLDIGGVGYTLAIGNAQFKTAGTYQFSRTLDFYIGTAGTLANPGEIQFSSDANATIAVNGWFIRIIKKA